MRILGNHRGVALFLVLWVLMLLMVIVGEFCHTMRTEVNITRNFKEETEAYYIAEAGLNRAVRELVKNDGATPTPGAAANKKLGNIFSNLISNSGGETSMDQDEAEDEEEKSVWRVAADIPPASFGGGAYKVSIGNESGKIDINRADQKFLEMLLDPFDLEDMDKSIIIDSIMDWRDPDDLHRLNGAEDDYYESLTPPYESRDAPFTSRDELLLVRGVTRELYFGGLKDMITVYTARASGAGGAAAKLFGGLKGARSGNPAAAGGPIKINVNAASPRLLRALPSMTDELVREILDFRKSDGFTSMSEINTLVGPEVYAAIAPLITLKNSVYYTIRSEGRLKDNPVRRGVEAMVMLDPRVKKKYRIVWRLDE